MLDITSGHLTKIWCRCLTIWIYLWKINDYMKLEFEIMHWGQPFFPMKKSIKKYKNRIPCRLSVGKQFKSLLYTQRRWKMFIGNILPLWIPEFYILHSNSPEFDNWWRLSFQTHYFVCSPAQQRPCLSSAAPWRSATPASSRTPAPASSRTQSKPFIDWQTTSGCWTRAK